MVNTKYMTTSGVVLTAPFWYLGCIIIRNADNIEADVLLTTGSAPGGAPLWRYVLGKADERSIRLIRTDDLLVETPVYATLSPGTTYIVHYRPYGP